MNEIERVIVESHERAAQIVTMEIAGDSDPTATLVELAAAGIAANVIRIYADALGKAPEEVWRFIAQCYAEVGANWRSQ